MSLKTPNSIFRKLSFAAGFAAALLAYALPASAQGISLLRDTETEEMLRSYETPLARAAGLDPVRQAIAANGVTAHVQGCDVADREALAAYIAAAAEALGGIDILVCNASGFGTTDDEAGWQRSIDVDQMNSMKG